jgi:hypothetical protein
LEETRFCPYCERWLDDSAEEPRRPRRGDHVAGGVTALITERALLTVGFVFFALLAVVCTAAALLI